MGKILIIIITNSPIVGQRGFKYDIANNQILIFTLDLWEDNQ